ncbi:DUF2508 domain-containing protein [Sporanaerobium hydrogeniformans]|uniref:DUF2508 domain-containing protein n=1 Tax=Sporanaerobium hydrogeniformans TaxID=3072179 RepID=A0AC61DB95_9FIRM|nr:DUF2508 family protein [Sporanaerobium hydrogeniformans]PHV70033.1 DUF2508 domain-containing protein [Sporanaerobium hydrogeniformans]
MKGQELSKQEHEKQALIYEICKLQEEMAVTLNQFSDVTEPELVDYYTYYYKANEIRHSYLLKKLKKIYYRHKE